MMYCVMIQGKIVNMTNNASVAGTHLHTAIGALYPDADVERAVKLFKSGTAVTVGCVSGLI